MQLIQLYADIRANTRPDARAVVLGNQQLTYGELYRFSNSLARALKSRGCRPGDRVVLMVSKTPLAIASILGVLKAGCIYVPLDVDSPAVRSAMILDNCGPRLLLVDAAGTKKLKELRSHSTTMARIPAGAIETSGASLDRKSFVFGLDDILHFPDDPIPYKHDANDIAYILYTSGSTGRPKGVPVTHANVAQFINWATSYFQLTPQDRISGHPPLYFDLSVFDIFGSFASGAELHLVPPLLNLSAPSLAAFIADSELTQWFSVPSALNYMAKADTIRGADFSKLKRVLWCGDVLPISTLRYWMERLPHVQFTNLYGPTETTIASSYYTLTSIPEQNETIPIGRSCDGEYLLVLDKALRPVPPETIGELYIGGAGLSPGYWKDLHKTRASFIDDPNSSGRLYKTGDLARVGDDGLIYFVGRTDTRIKSRGYRIELGEIEAALNQIKDLKESAVVAITTSGFEDSLICCAFVPVEGSEGARVSIITLRDMLRRTVPNYMLPARWLSMDCLPKNANGKIDRSLLQQLFRSTVTSEPKSHCDIQSIEV